MQERTWDTEAAWAASNDRADDVGAADMVAGMPRVVADLAEERLDGEETDAVVAWLRASGDQPPPWVIDRAVRIGRPAREGRRARPTLWRRVAAALVFDSRVQALPAGARAVGIDQLRLLYQAGAIEIDLEVAASAAEGRLRMLGQVTADDADLAHAWAVAEGPAGRVEAEVDELGQFALDGLVAGRHRLEIGLTSTLVEIPEVLI